MAKRKVKQITRVALVVDRSGSMVSIVDAARGAILEQINTIKSNVDKSDETFLTVVNFDNTAEIICDGMPVNDKVTLYPNVILQPRGMTAMNDGVKKTIELLRARRKTSGTAYLVVVISDGYENSSVTTSEELSNLIKELEGTGQWTFTFMLANQDIHAVANKLNLSVGNVASWTATAKGVADASVAMNNSMGNYFAGRSTGKLRSTAYYQESK